MSFESSNLESKEPTEYVSMRETFRNMGQMQYLSRLVNPDTRLHEDGTPYFGDIRINGDPNNYYGLSIHKDDARKFVEKWIEYKKSTSSFFDENVTPDDFLRK